MAISVAHEMVEEFGGRVRFLDIGAITDPKLLIATISSTLELPIQSADAVAALMSFLQTTRMLLSPATAASS